MNESAIVAHALSLADARQRASYLDSACGGDRELRRRIEAALTSGEITLDSRPDTPAAAATMPPDGTVETAVATGSLPPGYENLGELGRGGMGVVYRARHLKLNRTVALKFLPDRVNKDETAKARFLQEAQAVAALNHPNICTIFNVEESDGSLFMVMEHVEGGTLRNKIPFAKTDDAVGIALQIGEALQEAHTKNIVPRDIKADNVMLTSRGQAKVMDFGLAKLMTEKGRAALPLVDQLRRYGETWLADLDGGSGCD